MSWGHRGLPRRVPRASLCSHCTRVTWRGGCGWSRVSPWPRQVTLVQWEHIEALGTLLGRPLLPNEMRRNIAVAGINLLSLKDRRFRLGGALLETTGWYQPCGRLEKHIDHRTLKSVREQGGITARVIGSGVIRLDDPLVIEPPVCLE
ncbi:MOSC domain-containing protein [Pseudomonas aeruginosa]|uniref:MOSC domain-containing protein n=1 Tax=Pseudomonas aeruginosa TaxID=287 RepID=UPI00211B6551|nr:MOSC domain-containing protein [Pseudomonas aeruginosa]